MSIRKFKIPLSKFEDAALRHIYRLMRIPSDQYPRRPKALRALVSMFNGAVSGAYTESDVLHYIMTCRKAKKWVTFDGDYEPLKDIEADYFGETEWAALVSIFVAKGKGVEAYLFDDLLKDKLEQDFAAATGRAEPGNVLVSALMSLRKAGMLPTIGSQSDKDGESDIGFGDIGRVG